MAGVNSSENLPKSATPKVSRGEEFSVGTHWCQSKIPQNGCSFPETVSLLLHLYVFIATGGLALPHPLCSLGGGKTLFHRLCRQVMEHACLAFLAQAITLAANINRRRVM